MSESEKLKAEFWKAMAEADRRGRFVIAVEAKTDMSVGDVNAHVKHMKVLRGMNRFSRSAKAY